ncbi:MAG: hypothetical protein Q9223_001492 [Gallowayella weberi]
MDDKSSSRMAEKKDKLEAQVKSADMTDEMQQQAIEVALEAMEKFTIEKACLGFHFGTTNIKELIGNIAGYRTIYQEGGIIQL